MTILVLEGAKGAGKTSLSAMLQEELDWPVYRAFRKGGEQHNPGATSGWAKLLRFPINTWMEDMFVADVCSVAKPNLIMDRSMPSAVAYESMGVSRSDEWHKLRTPVDFRVALTAWADRMRRARSTIVFLKGTPKLLHMRNGARSSVDDVAREQSTIQHCCRLSGLPLLTLEVNSGRNTQAKNLQRILKLKMLNGGSRGNNVR